MRATELARLLRRGGDSALARADELAEAYAQVLDRAGRDAARRFRARAGASVLAAAPSPQSAMICLYPDPDEAVLLAQPGGEDAEILHVTLAFLGELDPDRAEEAAAIVRQVAAEHPPLQGEVGGVASFGPERPPRPEAEPQGAIFDAAVEHRPDGGYGDTFWREETATVWWTPADWSSTEEEEAARVAFAAIPGVERVEGEAEGLPAEHPFEGWEVVWRPGMHGLYPSILLPDVVGLAELRVAVCDALGEAGIEFSTMHGWTPHMTVAYTDEPSPPPARLIGRPLTFDRLSLAVGDRPRDFPLGGGSLLAAAPRDCACGHAYRDHLGDDGPCEIDGCSCKTYRPEAEEATVAAGMLTTYERTHGSEPDRRFWELVDEHGWTQIRSESWPCPSAEIDGDATFRQDAAALYDLGDAAATIEVGGGFVWVRAGADVSDRAREVIQGFLHRYPVQMATLEDGVPTVPMTFWSLGPFGPSPRLRMIEVASWDEIERNYAATVREQLGGLMRGFAPDVGGKLILWQGEPGTGKTWALRALATEWSDWADLHYITDPDAFFGEHANYMVDVLLHESDAVLVDDAVASEESATARWRVIVLEDAGSLLGADKKAGIGLSRLLNTVDGLIGQGLRVLVLVTTNDELGDLHPAVTRPGRCAAKIVFERLSPEEAAEWTGEQPEEEPLTIADLYARDGEEGDPEDVLAAAALAAAGGAADWAPPLPDELVDVDSIVSQMRTKSDPVRRAVIADVVGPAVEGVGLDFDATNPFVNAVVERTGQHVTYIADTTRLNVNRIVRAAYEEGLSIPDAASAIRQGMASASASRARMIARTEMAGLVNGGSLAATRIVSDATGTPYRKRWLTAGGAKHPRHALYPGLNGQERDLDEPFDVSGSRLDYPGDPSGPADETINCRCAVIAVEADAEVPTDRAEDLIPTSSTLAESPLPPIRGETPDELAASLIDQAKAMDPSVTRAMQEAAAAHGGELWGLEFRLKGQGSMARKVADDALERGQSLREAADNVADGLRYTVGLDRARYLEGMEGVLADLEARGLVVHRFRNTWLPDSPYRGVNIQLRAANGFRLELQFHTEASFELKQLINHPLYERWRVSKSAAERDRLWRQMMGNANRIDHPPGIAGYEHVSRGQGGVALMRPSDVVRGTTSKLDPSARDLEEAVAMLDREFSFPWAGVRPAETRIVGKINQHDNADALYDPETRQILVRRLGDDRYEAFVHEFGHFLDHGLTGWTYGPGGGGFGSRYPDLYGLKTLDKTIRDSDAYKNAEAALRAAPSKAPGAVTEIAGQPIYVSQLYYQLRAEELFARAFVQYLSLRDPRLGDRVRAQRQNPRQRARGWYWDDDDFEPIAQALDEFFRLRGWQPRP